VKNSGFSYEGHWHMNEQNGEGKIIYPDGRMWEGHFKDGHKHGRGKFTQPDGEVIYEIWNMGQVKEINQSISTSFKR